MARLCYCLTRFEVSSSFIISAGGSRKIARLKCSKRVGRDIGFLKSGIRQHAKLRPSAGHVEPGERKLVSDSLPAEELPVEAVEPNQPPNPTPLTQKAPAGTAEQPTEPPREPVVTFARVEPGE